MSTRRWAGVSVGLLMGCFGVAGGCGGDDSAPGANDGGGLGGDSSSACSTTVVVSGCNRVTQNNVEFALGCSSIANTPVNGRAVCATSGACNNGCLDPAVVFSCLANCRPQDGGDGGSSPLGTSCTTNMDCGGGLTCLKPTDNLTPGAGPPNGICTTECSIAANETLCVKTLGGICVSFSIATTKSFCMEPCMTGMVSVPASKCHGRLDTVCSALDKAGQFACVPLCATDSDCGTRKCDLGTGFCADIVTPGSPIGSPCMLDSDCGGAVCYPFDVMASPPTPGVCSAICRLGNVEGCGFRTTPLDAGPPVGACLLSTSTASEGDIGICAQLCDTADDCSTTDSRWTCVLDSDVRTGFGHNGYCWLGARPDGGTRDAAAPDVAPDTGVIDTGAPETSMPDTGAPEASVDAAAESGSDAPPDDSNPNDSVTPPADGATD